MGVVYNRSLNVFTGAVNSNFSNPNNWTGRYVPSATDAAFINANCVFDIDRTLGALVVGTNATASIGSGRTLTVSGSVNIQGHLSASGNPVINVKGVNNKINSFSPGTSTTYYNRSGDQSVAGCTYYNLIIDQPSTNTATGDITVRNNLTMTAGGNPTTYTSLELSYYNLIVSGATTLQGGSNRNGRLIKSQPGGNIVFRGVLNLADGSVNTSLDFSRSNPTVELQGGIGGGYSTITNFYPGNGLWKFTTNNQTIQANYGGNLVFSGDIHISGSITVTFAAFGGVFLNIPFINGETASSKLVNQTISPAGAINFTSNRTSMTTGIFDITSSVNTVSYIFDGDYTLPLNTYRSLTVAGSGTKSLASNTVLSGSLLINSGSLNISSSNLIVSGTTTVNGALLKTGPGSVYFNGNLIYSNKGSYLDFSSGNPTVTLAGGWNNENYTAGITRTGTGSWFFVNNNQTVDHRYTPYTLNGPVIISGSIAVTVIAQSGAYPTFANTVIGTESGSVLINNTIMSYQATQQPMLTGSLVTSGSSATFIYNGTGSNQFIAVPTGSKYYNLTLAGSGSKTLTGNISVQNTFSTGSSITLVTGSYTLTNP
jgi:hypothetical protein